MTNLKPRTVWFRRKREQKTNYTKRLHLLMSRKPRVVVRLTNTRVIAQVVRHAPTGDLVVVGVDSSTLKKLGWDYSGKNLPGAYLTGLLLAKAAAKKGITEAILDTGFRYPHPTGKVYAVLKGVVEGGLTVPHSAEVFPTPERLRGDHIAQYLKSRAQPAQIGSSYDQVKKKIMSS